MRTILRRKQQKSSKAGQVKSQYTQLSTNQKAHAYSETTELRRIALPDADFDRNVNFVLHSNQHIGDVFLEVDLAAGDAAMDYCKDVGLHLLKSFQLFYSGKEVQDCANYQAEIYELWTNQLMSKSVDPERRDELLRFCGGARGNSARKVLVPLPVFWSSMWHDLKKKECWYNGSGSNKLEFRFQFQPKSFCSSNHASNAINSVNVVYEELILPDAISKAVVPANKKNQVRSEFHFGPRLACTSGTEQEIPLHAVLAYGNIKTLSFRLQLAAATGAAADCLAIPGRCSTFKLDINGETVEELKEALETDLEQWLQGFSYEEDGNRPYRYTFSLNPHQNNDIAGFLPSAFDQMTCAVTPTATGTIQVITTIQKEWRWDGMGRCNKTD